MEAREDRSAGVEPSRSGAQTAFVVSRRDETPWRTGRAGMLYRDLVPGRLGGQLIASHIAIPAGGPVADYVHFHQIGFQMIYCARGWVAVVYEDQGPPFVLQTGDCVLQPPRIRHRVLESSPGLEVIEVACPADYETVADEEFVLPTPRLRRERDFDGQRFVHHIAATARWTPWRLAGFEARDLGLGSASGGRGQASVARCRGELDAAEQRREESGPLCWIVLSGTVTVRFGEERVERLGAGDACALPAATGLAVIETSGDLELLEVVLDVP